MDLDGWASQGALLASTATLLVLAVMAASAVDPADLWFVLEFLERDAGPERRLGRVHLLLVAALALVGVGYRVALLAGALSSPDRPSSALMAAGIGGGAVFFVAALVEALATSGDAVVLLFLSIIGWLVLIAWLVALVLLSGAVAVLLAVSLSLGYWLVELLRRARAGRVGVRD